MVKKCVIETCNKSNDRLYRFPGAKWGIKDPEGKIREKWIAYVKKERPGWEPCRKPNLEQSYLCFKHFQSSSFVNWVKYNRKDNLRDKRLYLRNDAVPSIHLYQNVASQIPGSPQSDISKKERIAMIKNLLEAASETDEEANFADNEQLTDDNENMSKVQGVAAEYVSEDQDLTDEEDMSEDQDITDEEDMSKDQVTNTTEAETQTPFTCWPIPVQEKSCTSRSTQTFLGATFKSQAIQCQESVSENADIESILSSDSEMEMEIDMESDYYPEEDLASQSDDDCNDFTNVYEEIPNDENLPANKKMKYIVFEACLVSLLRRCLPCPCKTTSTVRRMIWGTEVNFKILCNLCGTVFKWCSQPKIQEQPSINLLLSAAILFSGSIPKKAMLIFRFLNINTHVLRTYYRHQKDYLQEAITCTWSENQSNLLDSLQGKQVVLGGDARCDSMGKCAKFGCYSTMDVENNKILSTIIVQSNECGGSIKMELEGLKKTVALLDDLTIAAFISDRHPMIQKWVREEWKVTHYYDCWHVVKGLCKRMLKLSKKSGGRCKEIEGWIKSIKYHLYWCVMSSDINDQEDIAKKWRSCIEHIQNKHDNCMHGPLDYERNWLIPGTEASDKLEELLTSTRVMKDIKKMSSLGQTSGLECFHSVINHFAPKMIQFSFDGLTSRVQLAALHYNENSRRPQAVTKDGNERFRIDFPKYKGGGYVVRKILDDATYGYVDKCFLQLAHIKQSTSIIIQHSIEDHAPLTAKFEKPVKEEAVRQHLSRFTDYSRD